MITLPKSLETVRSSGRINLRRFSIWNREILCLIIISNEIFEAQHSVFYITFISKIHDDKNFSDKFLFFFITKKKGKVNIMFRTGQFWFYGGMELALN